MPRYNIAKINYKINPATSKPFVTLNLSPYKCKFAGEITDGENVFYQFECLVCKGDHKAPNGKTSGPANRHSLKVRKNEKEEKWDITIPCKEMRDAVSAALANHMKPKAIQAQHERTGPQAEPAAAASSAAADAPTPELAAEEGVFADTLTQYLQTLQQQGNNEQLSATLNLLRDTTMRVNVHDNQLCGMWQHLCHVTNALESKGASDDNVQASLRDLFEKIVALSRSSEEGAHTFRNIVDALASSLKSVETVVSELSQVEVPEVLRNLRETSTICGRLAGSIDALQVGQTNSKELVTKLNRELATIASEHANLVHSVKEVQEMQVKHDAAMEQFQLDRAADLEAQIKLAELATRKEKMEREMEAETLKIAAANAAKKEENAAARFKSIEDHQEKADKALTELSTTVIEQAKANEKTKEVAEKTQQDVTTLNLQVKQQAKKLDEQAQKQAQMQEKLDAALARARRKSDQREALETARQEKTATKMSAAYRCSVKRKAMRKYLEKAAAYAAACTETDLTKCKSKQEKKDKEAPIDQALEEKELALAVLVDPKRAEQLKLAAATPSKAPKAVVAPLKTVAANAMQMR